MIRSGFDVGQNGPMQSLIQHGYIAIFIFAMLESACIPIPSEVIFIFAGALCTTAVAVHHPLSVYLVIVVGIFGELTGALISYQVGRTLGRSIVDRWGKWILLSHKDLDSAERWFARFGSMSVLLGRVIPVVRSVISVPAGLAEMGRVRFIALTAVGSAVWISLLVSRGYGAGSSWKRFEKYFHAAQYPIIAIIVLVLAFGLWHRWRAVNGSRHAS